MWCPSIQGLCVAQGRTSLQTPPPESPPGMEAHPGGSQAARALFPSKPPFALCPRDPPSVLWLHLCALALHPQPGRAARSISWPKREFKPKPGDGQHPSPPPPPPHFNLHLWDASAFLQTCLQVPVCFSKSTASLRV